MLAGQHDPDFTAAPSMAVAMDLRAYDGDAWELYQRLLAETKNGPGRLQPVEFARR